jgi:peptide deformylase
MAVRKILQLGDPRLREAAAVYDFGAGTEGLQGLIEDLRDTLADSRKETGYGRGIAAPQLGVSKRVIFLQLPGAEPWPLINPQITQRSDEKIVVWDACLSFLAIFMQVVRHKEITVRYQDVSGRWNEVQAGEERDLSELLQHEIDHLDGILCIDRVTDVRTICTKDEFEKRYRANSPYAAVGKEPAT